MRRRLWLRKGLNRGLYTAQSDTHTDTRLTEGQDIASELGRVVSRFGMAPATEEEAREAVMQMKVSFKQPHTALLPPGAWARMTWMQRYEFLREKAEAVRAERIRAEAEAAQRSSAQQDNHVKACAKFGLPPTTLVADLDIYKAKEAAALSGAARLAPGDAVYRYTKLHKIMDNPPPDMVWTVVHVDLQNNQLLVDTGGRAMAPVNQFDMRWELAWLPESTKQREERERAARQRHEPKAPDPCSSEFDWKGPVVMYTAYYKALSTLGPAGPNYAGSATQVRAGHLVELSDGQRGVVARVAHDALDAAGIWKCDPPVHVRLLSSRPARLEVSADTLRLVEEEEAQFRVRREAEGGWSSDWGGDPRHWAVLQSKLKDGAGAKADALASAMYGAPVAAPTPEADRHCNRRVALPPWPDAEANSIREARRTARQAEAAVRVAQKRAEAEAAQRSAAQQDNHVKACAKFGLPPTTLVADLDIYSIGGTTPEPCGLEGSSIKIQPSDAGGGGGAHTTPEKDDRPASPAPILSAAPSSRSMLKKDEAHTAAPPLRLDSLDEALMVRVL